MNNRKDIWLYRMIVLVLSLTFVASVIGAIALVVSGKSTPQVIVASTAIGGLAGLWATSLLKI